MTEIKDINDYPYVKALEDNFGTIKREFDAFYAKHEDWFIQWRAGDIGMRDWFIYGWKLNGKEFPDNRYIVVSQDHARVLLKKLEEWKREVSHD